MTQTKKWLRRWVQDQRGDMAEKGVMLAILILAVLLALTQLGGKIAEWFTSVSNAY